MKSDEQRDEQRSVRQVMEITRDTPITTQGLERMIERIVFELENLQGQIDDIRGELP